MPIVNCCNSCLPSKLSVPFFATSGVADCIVKEFPIRWNGTKWTGGVDQIELDLECIGENFQITWRANKNGCNCSHTETLGIYGDCGELLNPVAVPFGGSVLPECCDNTEFGAEGNVSGYLNGSNMPVHESPRCQCETCCEGGSCERAIDKPTGAVKLAAPDLAMQQFQLPWPRQHHFHSREAILSYHGNTPSWTMPNTPFIEIYAGSCYACVHCVSCAPIWFEMDGNGKYQPVYEGPWTLRQSGGLFIYSDGSGSTYEFDEDTLVFRRYVPAGGEGVLEVTDVASNGFQVREMRREFTEGGVTTINALQLEYDDDTRFDPRLETVTYRRQVDGGSWSDLSRTVYTYYQDEDDYCFVPSRN